MTHESAGGQQTQLNAEERVERLWHIRRGVNAAFFIAFLVLVFGLVFHKTPYDVYLDAAQGRLIASGGLDATSHISAVTRPDALRLGWLWQVLAYGFIKTFGIGALTIITALLVAAGCGVALAALARRVNVLIGGFLILAAVYLSRECFVPCSQATGVFLFGTLAALLANGFESSGRRFWWAVPIMALWVNIDFSWPAGVALCVAFVPVSNIPRRWEKTIALLAALAATLANPDFYATWRVLAELPLNPTSPAGWIAPIAAAATTGKQAVNALAVIAVILALVSRAPLALRMAVVAAICAAEGVSRGTFPIAAMAATVAVSVALIPAVQAVMSTIKGKALGVFTAWVAPVAGPAGDEHLSTASEVAAESVAEGALLPAAAGADAAAATEGGQGDAAVPERATLRKRGVLVYGVGAAIAGAGLIAALTLFAWTAAGSADYSFGPGIEDTAMPAKAVAFVEHTGLEGIAVIHPKWAGYILWTCYPKVQLVFDPRPLDTTPVSAKLTAAVFETTRKIDDEQLARAFANVKVALAVIPRQQGWIRARSITKYWSPVYWDDISTVFVPDLPRNAAFIREHDQSLTYPEFFGGVTTKEMLPAVITALDKKTQEDPDCGLAQYEIGMAYYVDGQYEKAVTRLIIALGDNPAFANTWLSLGDIVRVSKSEDIVEVLLTTLSRDASTADAAAVISRETGPKRLFHLGTFLYAQATRYDRDFAMPYLRLGNLLMGSDNPAEAMRGLDALTQAAKADDRRPQLGDELRKQLDKQIELYKTALFRPRAPNIGSTGAAIGSTAVVESTAPSAALPAAGLESSVTGQGG